MSKYISGDSLPIPGTQSSATWTSGSIAGGQGEGNNKKKVEEDVKGRGIESSEIVMGNARLILRSTSIGQKSD